MWISSFWSHFFPLRARVGNFGETSKSKLDTTGRLPSNLPPELLPQNTPTRTAWLQLENKSTSEHWGEERSASMSSVSNYPMSHSRLKTLNIVIMNINNQHGCCTHSVTFQGLQLPRFFLPMLKKPYWCWLWFDLLLYPTSFWSQPFLLLSFFSMLCLAAQAVVGRVGTGNFGCTFSAVLVQLFRQL